MRRRTFVLSSFAFTGSLVAGCSADGAAEAPPAPTERVGPTPELTLPPGMSPNQIPAAPIPDGRVADAVARLTAIGSELMISSGVPGMAVAVVSGGKTIYATGFGVRDRTTNFPVDADTVFQLASLSKSVGSTVVAHQVGIGVVRWDTPIASTLPTFALADPYVTRNVTIADMYTHRSGLPEHAGDKLEDLGFSRAEVIDRLKDIPLAPFRAEYQYTNFGITAAAEAVAVASGQDWNTLSQNVMYGPLGMTSTSSSYADYAARGNKAVGHVLVDGKYTASAPRDPEAQSPAGGVSSSVNDIAKWMTMMLDGGDFGGQKVIVGSALLPAITAQIVSSPSSSPDARAGYYGYGFNVSTSAAGRTTISHSGAFALGAAANLLIIPSADVAIVALTNAAPIGLPETLTAEFADLVQFGEVRQDWRTLYKNAFAPLAAPQGELVGKPAPVAPVPAGTLPTYAGVYQNRHWGPATVTTPEPPDRHGPPDKQGPQDKQGLSLTIGPNETVCPLTHWDGDTFTFTLDNENANPGTVSKATFTLGTAPTLELEYFNGDLLGLFVK